MTLTEHQTTWKALRRSIVKSRFLLSHIPRFDHYANLDDEPFDDFRCMDANEVEFMLVDEIGILLMGDQTTNIRIETSPKFSLKVNPTADPHIRGLVMHFEQLIQYCVSIRKRCSQALRELDLSMTVRVVAKRCEGLLNQELADIVETVTTPKLMEFYYELMPMHDKLETAAQILEHITEGDLVGGQVLTLLATRIKKSIRDDTSLLLLDMEQAAMTTFLTKLYQWIFYGTVESDTTMEFMVWNTHDFTSSQLEILQSTTLPTDERTDLGANYRVLEELCPSQFSSSFLDIVKCGRFMHILQTGSEEQEQERVREDCKEAVCKIIGPCNDFIKLSPSKVKQRIIQVRDLYSTRILKLLREKYTVGEVFDVVHSLFLCLDVSWINLLLDEYDELLRNRVEDISENRLHVIWRSMHMKRFDKYTDKFDLFFESDSVLSQLFKESSSNQRWLTEEVTRSNFVCSPENWIEEGIDGGKEKEELTGWSGLSLQFKCPPMLAPMFTKSQLKLYSNVFRIFLECHVAIHRIGECLLVLPSLKDKQWRQASYLFSSINLKLSRFIEYWNLTVTPLVVKLRDDLRTALSIDAIASLHSEFLVKLGMELRLNDPRVLRPFFALCSLTRRIHSDEVDIFAVEDEFAEISTEMASALGDSDDEKSNMNSWMLMMMNLGR